MHYIEKIIMNIWSACFLNHFYSLHGEKQPSIIFIVIVMISVYKK